MELNNANVIAGTLFATVTSDGLSSASTQVAAITPVITANAVLDWNHTSGTTIAIDGYGFDPTTAHDTLTLTIGSSSVASSSFSFTATSTVLTLNLTTSVTGVLKAAISTNGQSSGATAVQVATVQ